MICEELKAIIIATLTHDVLRYAIGAGGVYLLINVALAGPLRNRKIRPDSPNWRQMRREILVSLRTVLIFALTGIGIAIGAELELFPIYADIGERGGLWFGASIVLIILAHDAWFYWSHRLIHRPGLFRHLHRTHHRSHNPSPFASYSFDLGEAVINAGFLPLFVAVVPIHPLALLIFVVHMMLRNALGHCGYEIFPADNRGRPLFGWLASVTHHDLHHANARYNLGLYFTWWDRWMGSEHPDYLSEFGRAAPRLPIQKQDLSALWVLAAIFALVALEAHAGERQCRGTGEAVRLIMLPDPMDRSGSAEYPQTRLE